VAGINPNLTKLAKMPVSLFVVRVEEENDQNIKIKMLVILLVKKKRDN
jgi:ribonucleotide reductase alpha subunit